MSVGDRCTIEINDQQVIDGFIEEMPVSYDDSDHIVNIIGRDNTGDLVDCQHDAADSEWKGLTVSRLIQRLCDPFSIAVVVDAGAVNAASEVVETFVANNFETIAQMIGRLARDYGLIVISRGDGKLTLTSISDSRPTVDDVVAGFNVSNVTQHSSNQNRFSSYKIKGVGLSTDNKSIEDWVSPSGQFSDEKIERFRPMVSFSETVTNSALAKRKAQYEGRMRAGFSRRLEYNFFDSIQSNGAIWEFHSKTNVVDDRFDLNDEKIIVELDYLFDEEQAFTTRGTLVDPDTFDISSSPIITDGVMDG